MENAEYRTLYALETDYWWFRGLHGILHDALRPVLMPSARLLDAGCGTGGLLARLGQVTPHAFGLDLSAEASHFWPQRGLTGRAVLASINELPYAAETFDASVSVDILECDGVHDRQAYAELVRVTRVGGLVLVVVPAYRWMMTRGHHQAVHAVRRYNRASVLALAESLPVEVLRLTHAFASVFPMVAGVRLWHRWQEGRRAVAIQSELVPLPATLNSALSALVGVERAALRAINMPFGSSLILLARRRA